MIEREGRGQVGPGKDADGPGIVVGAWFSLGGRYVDGRYRVMPRITTGVRVGMKLPDEPYAKRCFLGRFPDGGLLQRLTPLDKTAGNRPAGGRVLAFDQDNPIGQLDDYIYGRIGIAPLHFFMLPRVRVGVKSFYSLTGSISEWYNFQIMTPFIGIFVTSFFLALSGALMPGPLLTVTINESVTRGVWTGPLLIVGHAILELIFIIIILLGLGAILRHDLVLAVIAFAGSAVMLVMGYSMIRKVRFLTLSGVPSQSPSGTFGRILKHPVSAGVIVSLVNPYWTVWWLTIGLAYIFIAAKLGIAGVIVFFIGHISADFLWYSVVSASISLGKKFFTDGIYRTIAAFCGLFLLGFSAYFFKSGFDYLLK